MKNDKLNIADQTQIKNCESNSCRVLSYMASTNFLERSIKILQPPYRTPEKIINIIENDRVKNIIGNPPICVK